MDDPQLMWASEDISTKGCSLPKSFIPWGKLLYNPCSRNVTHRSADMQMHDPQITHAEAWVATLVKQHASLLQSAAAAELTQSLSLLSPAATPVSYTSVHRPACSATVFPEVLTVHVHPMQPCLAQAHPILFIHIRIMQRPTFRTASCACESRLFSINPAHR
jgi:hypothetical protein